MKTTVMFKTDKKRKETAQKIAKNMGIPFSAVMNRLIDEFIEEKKITFSGESYEPTPYLKRILDQGEKNLKEGKVKYFASVDQLFEDLNR